MMKPEWKEFLENSGAELQDHTVTSFGNTEQELQVSSTADVFADLSHYGLISAHGEDATTFLQGQFTNDIREVTEQHAQLSAYCNPKGRILANFMIFKRADTLYLRIPRNILEAVLKRLRMFVLNARVTLEDASQSLVHMGYSGPNAENELRERLEEPPVAVWDCIQTDGLTIIRLPGIHPRFEIFGELDDSKKLWGALNVNGAAVGEPAWSWLDIQAGIPTIGAETSEAFVPQMVNMQLINGVSFKKGCYTGQEVVARMQYLGKLKRRMYHAHIEADSAPATGDELYSSTSSSGQGSGKIVNVQPSPEGGYDLLAVVEINSREKGSVHWGGIDGPALEFSDPPYAFVEGDE